YTWSHTFTDSGAGANDVRNSGANDNIFDATMRFLNYGPAPFDRRHIFVATYSYNLPLFRRANGWRAVLGGWEISGVTRAETGEPYTVTATSSFGGSTIFNGRRRASYGTSAATSCTTAPCLVWFDGSIYAPAPADVLGNTQPGAI